MKPKALHAKHLRLVGRRRPPPARTANRSGDARVDAGDGVPYAAVVRCREDVDRRVTTDGTFGRPMRWGRGRRIYIIIKACSVICCQKHFCNRSSKIHHDITTLQALVSRASNGNALDSRGSRLERRLEARASVCVLCHVTRQWRVGPLSVRTSQSPVCPQTRVARRLTPSHEPSAPRAFVGELETAPIG
jgi:hypothetical protein